MATIKNELTGRASGKVGLQIYRITNGKTALCALPASFNVSQSEKSLEVRARFSLGLKLAHAMCDIPHLKHVWKNTSITAGDSKRTAFNKMMKANYPFVLKDGLDAILPIVPDLGFIAEKSAATLANDEITADINAIGTLQEIDPAVETSFQLACVVFCTSPTDNRWAPYRFISCASAPIALNLATPLSISITLAGSKTTTFDMYSVHRAFFTLLTLNAEGVPIHFSDTFTV